MQHLPDIANCCVLQDTQGSTKHFMVSGHQQHHLPPCLYMRTVTKGSLNGLVSLMGATTWRSMSPMAVQRPVHTTIARTSSSAWSSFHTCHMFKEAAICDTFRYIANMSLATLIVLCSSNSRLINIVCQHALMVAIWQCVAIAPIRCLATAEVMALKSAFGPCDTGRCVSRRHAKLLDNVQDVPAGSKFRRRPCLTGVSQDHMPCLQSLLSRHSYAHEQPALVIICIGIAEEQGKEKSAEQWTTAQQTCTAYTQSGKGTCWHNVGTLA